jgi:hypothetical protein
MVSIVGTLFLGVFVLIGAALFVTGLLRLRRWWTMRRLDPSGPFSVDPGLQEFEGRAHPTDDTLTPPFTEAESLVCEYEVERHRHDDDGSDWHTVESDTSSVPFELRQDGHTVAVDPDGAQQLLSTEFRVDTADDGDLPASVREYVDQHLGGADSIEPSVDVGPLELGARRYRFTEKRLDAGEDVYVLGDADRDTGAVPESDARLAVTGGEGGWRERVLGDPFVVADAGEDTAERRQLKRAVGLVLFGLVFGGLPLAVALA